MTVKKTAQRLARGGWTKAEVNRVIAGFETDGKLSKKERALAVAMLKRKPAAKVDGADNFVGHARAVMTDYLKVYDGTAHAPAAPSVLASGKWDVDEKRYRKNVEIMAGERDTTVAGKKVRFTDRFSPSPKNQLPQMLGWLGEQYDALGIKYELQPVKWKDKTFYNLVATIPGRSKDTVVLADHYDAADKEKIRKRNLGELSRDHGLTPTEIAAKLDTIPVGAAVPGADDNGSGTAAILEMAWFAKAQAAAGVKFDKTIKLVHLVGEEMPTDCLGGRAYVRDALERGEKIASVVVMDMIGVDRSGQKKMQISLGRGDGALEMGALGKAVAADVAPDLKPVLRPFGSRRSFLHQTDGVTFSKKGVPTVLLNEFLNDWWGLYRAGYHSEFDTTRLMDFSFATDVTRVAIEMANRLAGAKRAAFQKPGGPAPLKEP